MTDYTWPDDLAPYAVSFYLQAHSGGSESPFTRQSKVYGLSAPRWVCSMSFRGGYSGTSGLDAVGPRLDALIAKLAGRQNRIALSDFRRLSMRGTWPITAANDAASVGATSIKISGLPIGTPIYNGDYIGGDGRPHIITDGTFGAVHAVADSLGEAVVSFEPPLQTDVPDFTAVFGNPTGLFRLTDDDAGANGVQVGDAVNVSLNFVEDVGAAVAAVSPIYPLDDAGALPAAAYSTRKLTATYSGPCCRVVRPSDSATLDVGFSGQDLDVAALDAFLGSEIGHVSIWYDQSGSGLDSTQTTDANRPLVENGLVEGGPVLFKNKRPLIFNEQYMAIPAGVTANRNAVNVFMALESLVGPAQLGAFIQLGSGGNQFTTFQQETELWGSGMPNLTKALEQRPALYEIIGNGTTGTIDQDFDSSTGTISAASLAGGFIGNTDVATGYLLSAYVSAVIIYPRILTADQDDGLKSNMRRLFNLITVANSGRVVCVGDSILAASAGTAYGYGFVKMAQRALPNDIAFYNFGQGGTQIQNKVSTYATDGAGVVLREFTDKRIVINNYGTNDLTLGGRTATQIYNDHAAYAALVHADGGLYVPCTLTPNAAWDGTQQATWNSFNAMIRAAPFADAVCDLAAHPVIGPFSAASDTSLYGDGLHLTRLAHTYAKAVLITTIEPLLAA